MGLGAAALVYGAVTLLLFHNLLPGLATHLYPDLGDPLLNTAVLAWNAKRGPLTEPWWNFPAFAPLLGMTSLTEHLLVMYPVTTPVIWITGNLVLAYNLVVSSCAAAQRPVMGEYRSLNGYSGYVLPGFSARARDINDRRDRALDELRRRNTLYVLVASEQDPTLSPWIAGQPGAERVSRRGEFEVYRLPELR